MGFSLIFGKNQILFQFIKKVDKQIVKNYCLVSLLPVCVKMFERLIFNQIFKFLDEGKLISQNQTGFWPSDSCEYQLLSTAHCIYNNFYHNLILEIRANFFSISKAFNRVWYKGLLYKQETFEILGDLLNLWESFLNNWYQNVVLNGQRSSWSLVKAGVWQGLILAPLLFSVYVNDLPDSLESLANSFADDTLLFCTVSDSSLSAILPNNDLTEVSVWTYKWKITFNPGINKTSSRSHILKANKMYCEWQFSHMFTKHIIIFSWPHMNLMDEIQIDLDREDYFLPDIQR